jgi:hypothetical protein
MITGTSKFAGLIRAAMAAVHALRSYQHGNSSPELAEEIADALNAAIEQALDDRDAELDRRLLEVDQQIKELTLLLENMPQLRTVQQIEDLLMHCKDGHCLGSHVEIATMRSTLEWVLGRRGDAGGRSRWRATSPFLPPASETDPNA